MHSGFTAAAILAVWLVPALPAWAGTFPDAVLAATQQYIADCRAIDQPANPPAQFVRSARFAGGTAYVIDTHNLGCMAYCGSAGLRDRDLGTE